MAVDRGARHVDLGHRGDQAKDAGAHVLPAGAGDQRVEAVRPDVVGLDDRSDRPAWPSGRAASPWSPSRASGPRAASGAARRPAAGARRGHRGELRVERGVLHARPRLVGRERQGGGRRGQLAGHEPVADVARPDGLGQAGAVGAVVVLAVVGVEVVAVDRRCAAGVGLVADDERRVARRRRGVGHLRRELDERRGHRTVDRQAGGRATLPPTVITAPMTAAATSAAATSRAGLTIRRGRRTARAGTGTRPRGQGGVLEQVRPGPGRRSRIGGVRHGAFGLEEAQVAVAHEDSSPSRWARTRFLARWMRDRTVPIGTSSARAMSS